ncbi:unnamed protein product [Gongylonema pulchrum]|uniref:Gag-pol polyprotein n=1 Tax=Gongylonema pulchrum TaxID=637853 RepID=A0A183DTZ7_9BILA|nr:unnamed protein product [Gongylonema pulchrum]
MKMSSRFTVYKERIVVEDFTTTANRIRTGEELKQAETDSGQNSQHSEADAEVDNESSDVVEEEQDVDMGIVDDSPVF